MHQSENAIPLKIRKIKGIISAQKPAPGNVEFIILPYYNSLEDIPQKEVLYAQLNKFLHLTDQNTTIAILTSPMFAVDFCSQLGNNIHLKLWIAVKLENVIADGNYLARQHASLLILTRYKGSLRHTKTRIGYSYCPYCDKTTKDYGGKKHLYHEFGTLLSDVWRDITVNFEEHPTNIANRLSDLFGNPEYGNLNIYDQRQFFKPLNRSCICKEFSGTENSYAGDSILLSGDCLEHIRKIPDNSIDFCFADPPYNLKKKYENWNDSIDVQEYFLWCDQWLGELARVLKPGRTLAVLNIPNGCIRHFKYLNTILDYQDWIIWEGLSFPVRRIMPAHYSILCFSKGTPRTLPAIVRKENSLLEQQAIHTIKEGCCVRNHCVNSRNHSNIQDKEFVSNVWHDIHRLKHNSRRVDHPCQLPPMFMYRLISLFTDRDELVLDPFNGVGTTTLASQQLNRKYIGIELSEYYHNIAKQRHIELSNGVNPFRKVNSDTPKAKNSPVRRLQKQKYEISKKTLQLEIKAISEQIGHIPTKEEIMELSKYPFEYFENYFHSWGEVRAAARTTGMTENKLRDSMLFQ